MKEKISHGMLKLSELVIKLKVPIVIFVILLTVFFGYKAKDFAIDSDISSSLPDSDYDAKLYKEIGDKYEGNSAAMIIFETDNVFNYDVIQQISQITDSISYITGVSYVTSLTNIIDIKSSEWGIEIGKLVDSYNLPDTQDEIDSLRNRIFEKEMYKGVIVTEDSTATVIIANFMPDTDHDSIIEQIKLKVKSIKPTGKIYYSGIPFMMKDVQSIILRDLVTLLPITALIIILILFLGFRSLRGVILPVLNVLISIIWTIGLMTWLGVKLTIISDAIPIILFALGSAYSIHALNRINLTASEDKVKALILSMAYIVVPIFLAFITTAMGFVSFIFGSYLTMIKEFGIFTAVGITFAFLLSVTFTPSLVALTRFYGKNNKKSEDNKIASKFLKPLSEKIMIHPKRIVIIWLILAVLGVIGTFFIERKVDIVSYFKKTSDTRIAQDLADAKLGGSSPIYFLFRGDVQSPEFLKFMKNTQDYLKQNSEFVEYTMSVADLVAKMNDAMGEGYKIPDEKEKIEQLWMLIESEDIMPQLVNFDLTEAVIQGRFASLDSRDTRKFVADVQKYLTENKYNNITVEFTGMPSIYNKIDTSLINSQFSSLILAVVFMLLIVSLTLWSFKDGLLSLIPLILTILISFGFMGFAGIPLDIATVLVASVTLGVGIDYAIHIVSHYRNYLDETNDIKTAVSQAILASGNAIFINVLAVAFGFLVFLLSNLVPLGHFGLMMALSMIVSGFAAVTLLPALIIFIVNKKHNR